MLRISVLVMAFERLTRFEGIATVPKALRRIALIWAFERLTRFEGIATVASFQIWLVGFTALNA